MADTLAIFRINYKSDFIITLESDAGWATPFCIKFWTDSPQRAFYVQYDGETYTHCAPVAGEPTKLSVQFDDHHLGIGDLKYQIAYHFTVADFPNDTEDEVLNQAAVIINEDGQQEQVMLDLQGETAPEIAFSLPAYANEQQRIANEEQRIANEEQRIAAEETRQRNEQQRINQETARVNEFATLKSQSQAATRNANDSATLANQKAQLAADKAALAQQKAEYAQQQGDYAKAQGETAQADHERAESDHGIAADDHTQAGNDHTRAESDHGIAADDHTQAGNDHTRAESDHTRAESDHAAVEVYVDSLGAFDISAYHATGGVLAKYADLTAALGTNGANIPDALRKGGMSVKFVLSSDNKYVQYRLMSDSFNTTPANWQGVDDEPTAGSDNLVKSGGIYHYVEVHTSSALKSKECEVEQDLLFSDEKGNVLVEFANGHIYTKNFNSENLKSLYPTNVLNFGDSIAFGENSYRIEGDATSKGYSYAVMLSEILNISCLNLAVSGYTTQQILSKINSSINTEKNSTNIILLEGGTNDFSSIHSTGDLGSVVLTNNDIPTSEITFADRIEKICYTVKNNWKKSFVFWVIPHRMETRDLSIQERGWEIVKEACRKWGIVVIDIFSNSSFTASPLELGAEYTDYNDPLGVTHGGTHPNTMGYKKYYLPLIYSKILDYCSILK